MVCRRMGRLLATLCLAELCMATVALRSNRVGSRMPPGLQLFDDLHEPENYTYDPQLISGPSRGLHGKNLLLVGDSNERKLIHLMCAQYGGEVHSVETMKCGDLILEFPVFDDNLGQQYKPSSAYFCHVPAHDLSIMSFFHFGALGVAPFPNWHSETISRHENLSYHFPKINNSASLPISAADMICWWRDAISRSLPRRPSVVVAQSSLWDSIPAREFLFQHRIPAVLPKSGLEPWGWIRHAAALMESLRGLGAQKLYWRTNSNCPLRGDARDRTGFIGGASEAMAVSVRKAIAARKGIWSEVGLIDWRKDFVAVDEDDCNWVHYRRRGYAALIDSIQKALDEAV